jgi:hypothetical protein
MTTKNTTQQLARETASAFNKARAAIARATGASQAEGGKL